MKAQLGNRLLADLLQWDDTRATQEFAWLETLVEYKYDHYQGYAPGSRFYVNFLSWLAQFDPVDRDVAYRFIKDRLVYISQREIHHLIGLTYPRLQRDNRFAVAKELGIPFFSTWGNEVAELRVRELSARTLYVGLSDGARTDVLRRFNEGIISNEQIVAAPEISESKWDNLHVKLKERLVELNLESAEPTFARICLVDDFTASGTTLIREADGKWSGKIPKFMEAVAGRFADQVASDCALQIHHYIGTVKARRTIDESLKQFLAHGSMPLISVEATYSMVLKQAIVISDESPSELVAFVKKYYGKSCQSTHTNEDIWFGYKQCGLPLVLEHNTPNNSVALLWAASKPNATDDKHIMKPLYPRKQRHLDHGQSV
jgi:hypothetical protein